MDYVEKLVTFAILMENNEGIRSKAPSYIMQKWLLCETANCREHLEKMLDRHNLAKFHFWLERWETHLSPPESTSSRGIPGDHGP